MSKKYYPNPDLLRKQGKLVCHAIEGLTQLGIEIIAISFNSNHPVIQVQNWPANRKIRSHFTGQGINERGEYYHRKSSLFCGCQVKWQEVQHG